VIVKRFAFWALMAVSLSANLAMAAVAVWQRRLEPASEPRLFSKVALDPDQRARIAELRSRLMATRHEHVRRITELRQQLAGTIMHQPADPAAVEGILRSISEVQAGYQEAVVAHVLAVRDVLRPEQRPAFEKVVAEQMSARGPMQHGDCPVPAKE
jgi:Spy/CpxP family protein refolding chaperone